jgi:hypothetical protein
MVGGKIVYAAGDFARFDEMPLPPAMPDWSPVKTFGGYGAWGDPKLGAAQSQASRATCACAQHCDVHGHDHAKAWSGRPPVSDLKAFWGALGCACWAV